MRRRKPRIGTIEGPGVERQGQVSPTDGSRTRRCPRDPPLRPAASLTPSVARWATCGWLMMGGADQGAERSGLVILKVAAVTSSSVSFLPRARAAMSPMPRRSHRRSWCPRHGRQGRPVRQGRCRRDPEVDATVDVQGIVDDGGVEIREVRSAPATAWQHMEGR